MRIKVRCSKKETVRIMKIEDEMPRLPTLKHVGLALVEFVYSLERGTFAQKTTD